MARCPQCGVAKPLITKVGSASFHYKHPNTTQCYRWHFTAECSHCHRHILFYGATQSNIDTSREEPSRLEILQTFPSLEVISDALPPLAAKFLQQAIESRHAPDGALMLAASAIDAMLKDKGLTNGSLYSRIKSASDQNLLTSEMAAWAHEIRLSANEPRHADEEFTGATAEDAEQILAFTRALGEYLYDLPSRVKKMAGEGGQDSMMTSHLLIL